MGSPCANNCGFYGTPENADLCSSCFHNRQSARNVVSIPVVDASSSSSSSDTSSVMVAVHKQSSTPSTAGAAPADEPKKPKPTRCKSCCKKVGLTGIRCRCGHVFCALHRYPNEHGCTFDFKAMARDAIAKAKPLIQAPKLQKI